MGRPNARAISAVARYKSNVARASPLSAVNSASCESETSSCVLRPRVNRRFARRNASCASLAFWRRAGEKLLDCLEQLPLPQRSAFLLHHDDGLALDEVARALEVGFETAKTRLRYAMSKLRTCMGAYLDPVRGPAR